MERSTLNKEVTFPSDQFIVSKTDREGRITYGNQLFIDISGYSEQELLGKPHNILRHPDMPKCVFKLLWERINEGKEIFAYVKNMTKNGAFYWVHAYVTPMYSVRGDIVGYHSVRRSPSSHAIHTVEPLYKKLLEAERHGGVSASTEMLHSLLNEQKVSYDEFSLSFA